MHRADVLLVERGHYESRARARAAIEAGLVEVDGKVLRKAATVLDASARVTRAESAHPYVSRGALKLVGALDHFGIDPAGRLCLDVGASTGGFTEVLLLRGAAAVDAVDVGHGQMHARIASDPRVSNLQSTDARRLDGARLRGAPSLIVCDVSFISLALVLPAVLPLAAPQATLVALIKPQFEAGPGHVSKGIVRDEAIHDAVCAKVAESLTGAGWRTLGIVPSPIEGGDGNREFLIGASRE